MTKNRERKEAVVKEIADVFAQAKSAVVVDYQGLSVAEATELRNRFRAAGVEYHIYKNRLVKLAIEGTEFDSLSEHLTGPNGIAFGMEDAVSAARVAKEYAKENKKLELRLGVVEGQFYGEDMINKIADIPSRDVLIAKFMGSIKSPVNKFAYMLKAVADSKGEENE